VTVFFDWLGIAEGVANDARGALTLVGVNQNVLIAPQFPHNDVRTIIILAVDEEGTVLTADASIDLDIQLVSPAGKVLFANHQSVNMSAASNPAGIPPEVTSRGFQFVGSLSLQLTEYGRHVLSATIVVGDAEPESRSRNLWVVRPPSSSDPQ
jgi:hypothetical protein